MTKAMDIVDHSLLKEGHLEDDWNDWIIIHVLVREATALVPATATPRP